MILVENLVKIFETITAVQSLTLAVHPGEILGLVGPNGAGKSTLLKCIAGILEPSSGNIRIFDHDIQNQPVEAKTLTSFVPELPGLYEDLTVWEHVSFVARLYGMRQYEEKADMLLEKFDLAAKKNDIISTLSKGMKQKTALCCGLIHSPKALLLDEPLIGIDPKAMRTMRELVRQEAQNGAAVIMSSHQLDLVEKMCDRVLIVNQGQRVIEGTVTQIHQQTGLGAEATLEDIFLALTDKTS